MKLHLTEAQLLAEWQLRRFPQWTPADCTMTVSDGIDAEAWMRTQMDDWYHRALHEAPMEMLAPCDITVECRRAGQKITLPQFALRVAEVDSPEWERPALIVTDPTSPVARRQSSPYTCGTVAEPVAIVSGSTLRVYPDTREMPSIKAIVCDEGVYSLDAALLDTIRPWGEAM